MGVDRNPLNSANNGNVRAKFLWHQEKICWCLAGPVLDRRTVRGQVCVNKGPTACEIEMAIVVFYKVGEGAVQGIGCSKPVQLEVTTSTVDSNPPPTFAIEPSGSTQTYSITLALAASSVRG